MECEEIDDKDRELIKIASEVINRNYTDPRHTVAAAVLCSSGKIYAGVNIESCGYGPCAEPIAIGRAITEGERVIERIVAVGGPDASRMLPPCGNCRQLLFDYAPDCRVILQRDGILVKAPISLLLPEAYGLFQE